ncbi:MAG: hypothetical protein NC332_05150, partial [Firmicutes bacterium]|nr:hypothetical protein [Bacillota bacterium]
MAQFKHKGSVFSEKSSKGTIKQAEKNIAKKTAEIEKKVKAKQQSVKNAIGRKQKDGKNTVNSNRLKLLVTVVSRNKAEFYLDLIQSFDVNMQCVTIANGTADKSTLGLLGLADSDKAVIFSVIQESKLSDALHMLENKFKTIKGGKGVACTVPLTSVIGTLIYGFLSNNRDTV